MARAVPNIGHAATRARGTLGGSLAHADPAAELPLVAVTLDAIVTIARDKRAERCRRRVLHRPDDHRLPAGALLTGVRFPVWTGKVGVGFHEVNARRSDFAFASAAAQVELDDAGNCKRIAVGIGAVTDIPLRAETRRSSNSPAARSTTRAVRAAVTRSARRYRTARGPARHAPPIAAAPRPALAVRAIAEARAQCARRFSLTCASNLTSTARPTTLDVEPRTTLLDACATVSASRAPMPAASTASAAPARCWSTAWRCAPA